MLRKIKVVSNKKMILNHSLPIETMQKVSIAQNLVTSYALTFKNLLNFSKGLPSYGKLFG